MLARIQAGSVSCFSGLSLFKLLVSPSDVSRTPSEQKPAMWRIDLSRATALCMRPPSGRVVVHKNSDAVLYSLAERPQSARWTTKRDAPARNNSVGMAGVPSKLEKAAAYSTQG